MFVTLGEMKKKTSWNHFLRSVQLISVWTTERNDATIDRHFNSNEMKFMRSDGANIRTNNRLSRRVDTGRRNVPEPNEDLSLILVFKLFRVVDIMIYSCKKTNVVTLILFSVYSILYLLYSLLQQFYSPFLFLHSECGTTQWKKFIINGIINFLFSTSWYSLTPIPTSSIWPSFLWSAHIPLSFRSEFVS